jgi:hypothetical protein
VEKHYYSAQSLSDAVREFEREYCSSSADVYAAYMAGECPQGMARSTQAIWASFYEEILRLTGGQGITEDEPVMTRVGRALVSA